MNQPLVSVVIPTRNRKEMVSDCIDSILDSTYKNIEVIVVDDASTDGAVVLLNEKFGKKIRLFHSEEHIMMVKSRNLGAKKSNGKYVLFVDDDNIVDSEMTENLVECVELDETYGIVGPKMYFYDDKEHPYLLWQKINLWAGRTTVKNKETNGAIVESDGIPNVFMVRKEALEKVGYFDEALMQTWTEPDLSYRLKIDGYKTVCCHKAITYHRVNPSDSGYINDRLVIGGGFKHKAYFLTRNRFVILKRYGNTLQKVTFTVLFSWVYVIIYSLIALIFKRFDTIRLYWLGFRDGMYYMITDNLKNSFVGDTNNV